MSDPAPSCMCERLWRGCHWTLMIFKDPPNSVLSICQWVTDTSLLQETIFRYKLRTIVFPEMGYFTTCLLFATLISLAYTYSLDDLKGAVLEKLGLKELPNIHKRDLENLVIPAHIKNKYLSMLKQHNKRRRRSLPSLAGILRGISGNAGKYCICMYKSRTDANISLDFHLL